MKYHPSPIMTIKFSGGTERVRSNPIAKHNKVICAEIKQLPRYLGRDEISSSHFTSSQVTVAGKIYQ
jgi:hypothetical protein